MGADYNNEDFLKEERIERTEIKEKNPNAYNPWDETEQKILLNLFKKGTSIKEIAEILGRQEGGIRSRLLKLGVDIPDLLEDKTREDSNGYLRSGGKDKLIHREVVLNELKRKQKKLNDLIENFEDYVIHHKDENKKNNNLSNLEIMTRKEHAKEHGWL